LLAESELHHWHPSTRPTFDHRALSSPPGGLPSRGECTRTLVARCALGSLGESAPPAPAPGGWAFRPHRPPESPVPAARQRIHSTTTPWLLGERRLHPTTWSSSSANDGAATLQYAEWLRWSHSASSAQSTIVSPPSATRAPTSASNASRALPVGYRPGSQSAPARGGEISGGRPERGASYTASIPRSS
jgi:hypothetical protein